MRQRKIKNVDEKMMKCQDYKVDMGEECAGNWKEIFGNDRPIYLELGCGKGRFLMSHAVSDPNGNYIGIEGQDSVVLRALEKASASGLSNIRFSGKFIKDLRLFFGEAELAGIYLNFSDPWPKTRHDKRRLTHRGYLEQYRHVLGKGGFIEMKTDNDGLFDFTLEEVNDTGIFQIEECSRDLHNTQLKATAITTEYEDKFRAQGLNINYVRLK